MKLHRFFLEEKIGDRTEIVINDTELSHQLRTVFRFEAGDKVILFDNSGFDFLASIERYEKESVHFSHITSSRNTVVAKKEIHLFASIVKKDTFEWIVQKATELGVSQISPIVSERSEKKNINIDRLRKIMVEASEQSGRAVLPTLNDISDFPTVLKNFNSVKAVALHTIGVGDTSIDPTEIVSQDFASADAVFIGPEGGWSPREIDLFVQHKIPVRSLGPQVLRSETAVVVALAKLLF